MTPIDPFERQLPAALTRLADPRTPDYLTDILGRTARTRQRSAWRSLERWLPMPSLTSPRAVGLLAVAALALALIGSALLGGGGPTPGPSATPSATPSAVPTPSSSPADVSLPDGVLGGWVAGSRGTLAEGPGDLAFMVFGPPQDGTPVTFWIDPPGLVSTILSAAEADGPDVVSIRTYNPDGGCRFDSLGRYRWSTTADGQWLTMTLIEDACDVRSQIVPGTWQRSAAHHNAGGPVIAALFEPMFTMTLPPGEYIGRGAGQRDSLVVETETSTYKVWRDLDGFVDPCDIDAGRIDLEGMDGVLAYFEEDPRFSVTDREEFTIDGRPAVAIRFTIGTDIEAPCWTLDGNANDRTGVLTFVPHSWPGGFWNDAIGGMDGLVVTEVDGVSLTFEWLTFHSGLAIDRETLDTIRFVDGLPEPPAS